jgi:hypothetical protein
MNLAPIPGTPDTSARARWMRRRRIIIPLIAALIVIGGFLMFGPIGLGSGPLALEENDTTSQVLKSQGPLVVSLALYNSGHGLAVIDDIKLVGGTGYAGPRALGFAVLTTALCGGAWPARVDGTGFGMSCGGRYHGALIGRGIGFTFTQHVPPPFPAAAEVAAPPLGTCWVMTEVIIHYHVGIRHYTATDPYELAVCAKNAAAQVNAAVNASDG